MFLKFGSHYNLPIPTCDLQVMRCAFVIGVSTIMLNNLVINKQRVIKKIPVESFLSTFALVSLKTRRIDNENKNVIRAIARP